MNDVQFTDGADSEVLVPHVEHLRHVDGRESVAVEGNIVQEELEVADHYELAHPPLLHTTAFRYLDIPFVRSANSTCWINSKRPFCCKNQNLLVRRAFINNVIVFFNKI